MSEQESPLGEKLAVITERMKTMATTMTQMKDENTAQNMQIIEQVKMTNGRVTELEKKQIEHETEVRILKEQKRDRIKDWIAPVVTALITGGLLLAGGQMLTASINGLS